MVPLFPIVAVENNQPELIGQASGSSGGDIRRVDFLPVQDATSDEELNQVRPAVEDEAMLVLPDPAPEVVRVVKIPDEVLDADLFEDEPGAQATPLPAPNRMFPFGTTHDY